MKGLLFVALSMATLATIASEPSRPNRPGGFPCPAKRPSALARHPTVLVLHGQEVVMDGWVWQDSQPPGNTGATIRLHLGDTSQAFPRLQPIAAWVACGPLVRRLTPTAPFRRADAGENVLEYDLAGAPDWGPYTYDDFLVRLRDSTGHIFYLRAARTFISAVQ